MKNFLRRQLATITAIRQRNGCVQANEDIYPASRYWQSHLIFFECEPMSDISLFESVLKQHGLRITHQRLQLLQIIYSSEVKYLSMEKIFFIMESQKILINPSTIYRSVVHFQQVGILTKLMMIEGETLFKLKDTKNHGHLICLQCKKIKEFRDDLIEKKLNQVAEKSEFSISHYRHFLYCKRCKTND